MRAPSSVSSAWMKSIKETKLGTAAFKERTCFKRRNPFAVISLNQTLVVHISTLSVVDNIQPWSLKHVSSQGDGGAGTDALVGLCTLDHMQKAR